MSIGAVENTQKALEKKAELNSDLAKPKITHQFLDQKHKENPEESCDFWATREKWQRDEEEELEPEYRDQDGCGSKAKFLFVLPYFYQVPEGDLKIFRSP